VKRLEETDAEGVTGVRSVELVRAGGSGCPALVTTAQVPSSHIIINHTGLPWTDDREICITSMPLDVMIMKEI